MLIVDSQVHVWNAIPEAVAAKHDDEPGAFSHEHLLAEMERAGVTAAILVPRSFDGACNDYALAAAQAHPARFAVMGRVPLQQQAGAAAVRRWRDQPGMLGVRLTFHRDLDRPLLTDGSFDWFWPLAEHSGLPVMVHAPERLEELAKIARHYPGLRIILDHMGFARANIDDAVEPAIERLLRLADLANFHVKLSAAPCYSRAPYPHANLRAPIRRVVDAFGAERCFWGSDLTRLPNSSSYKQCVRMFTDDGDGFLRPDELASVMGVGLAACLGWPNLSARETSPGARSK